MNNDEAARRAYWADQMEQGYAIVQKLIVFPVNECGERFASIPDAAAAAGVRESVSAQVPKPALYEGLERPISAPGSELHPSFALLIFGANCLWHLNPDSFTLFKVRRCYQNPALSRACRSVCMLLRN